MPDIRLSLLTLALLAACSKPADPAAESAAAAPAASQPVTPPAVITPPEEPAQPLPMTLVYHCENDAQVTLANLDDQGSRIALTLPGEAAVELTQAQSASGVRYEDGKLVFLGKGDEAVIEREGKAVYSQCKLQSAG